MYSLSQGSGLFKKRESTVSEGTTTTLVVCHVPQNNAAASGKAFPPYRSPLLPPGEVGWDKQPREDRRYPINSEFSIYKKNLFIYWILPRATMDTLLEEEGAAIFENNSRGKLLQSTDVCVTFTVNNGYTWEASNSFLQITLTCYWIIVNRCVCYLFLFNFMRVVMAVLMS